MGPSGREDCQRPRNGERRPTTLAAAAPGLALPLGFSTPHLVVMQTEGRNIMSAKSRCLLNVCARTWIVARSCPPPGCLGIESQAPATLNAAVLRRIADDLLAALTGIDA